MKKLLKLVQINKVLAMAFFIAVASFGVKGMLITDKVSAAASVCFAQTAEVDGGKSFFKSTSCPSSATSTTDKCFVSYNTGGAPKQFDNGLACAADMLSIMNTNGALPPGCPYSNKAGPPAPGAQCPYNTNGFGTLNSGFESKGIYDDSAAIAACNADNPKNCDFIEKFINPVIKFLSAGVGVVITIMIVIGGIQYTSAGDDPQKVAAAKKKIYNAIIALILFIFLFALLSWIIPGGLV